MVRWRTDSAERGLGRKSSLRPRQLSVGTIRHLEPLSGRGVGSLTVAPALPMTVNDYCQRLLIPNDGLRRQRPAPIPSIGLTALARRPRAVCPAARLTAPKEMFIAGHPVLRAPSGVA